MEDYADEDMQETEYDNEEEEANAEAIELNQIEFQHMETVGHQAPQTKVQKAEKQKMQIQGHIPFTIK